MPKMRNGFFEVPNMALGEMSDIRPYWSYNGHCAKNVLRVRERKS